jgi:Zn-dependent protease
MMLNLRRFLCGCFGFLSLFFFFVSFCSVPNLVRYVRDYAPVSPSPRLSLAKTIIITVAYVLGGLIIAIPLIVAFINGMAWWTIRKGKVTARGWAIAACIMLILASSLLILPMKATWRYLPVSVSITLLALNVAMIVLGISGLVAFAHRDSTAQALKTAKPLRIAGDGTSSLLDKIVWLLAIAGYWGGMDCWDRWGRAHQLTFDYGYLSWVHLIAAILIVTILHESGHALTGLALGMKLGAYIIGPFQWSICGGRWKFQFVPKKFFSLGGAAALVPSNPKRCRWREVCMIAAGPTVNLMTGIIALRATLAAAAHTDESLWRFFALLSTVSFVVFVTNLIPMRPAALYSDGARIYQLLRGGPPADYFRAASIASASLLTPIRSRDYDIEAIQRASRTFTQGGAAVFLRLVASEYFLDNGKIPQAREAFDDAERVSEQSVAEIPVEYYPELAFGNAFLRRDAPAARKWRDRMVALKPAQPDDSYWLAESAMLWIEGRREEALLAWEKGNLLAQKLPSFGGNEFERCRFSLLRGCIESEVACAAG